MDDLQTRIIIGLSVVIGFAVLAVFVGTFVRDLITKMYYEKKSPDHIWAEFAPKVGKGFSKIIKLENLKTGQFKYQGRTYYAGDETWQAMYPPGRSALAQVAFTKCLANPENANMLTHITGAPSIDARLVFAMAEQKDTINAMERSEREAGGGVENKNMKILMLVVIVVGILVIVGGIFSIKGAMVNDDILKTLQAMQSDFQTISKAFLGR